MRSVRFRWKAYDPPIVVRDQSGMPRVRLTRSRSISRGAGSDSLCRPARWMPHNHTVPRVDEMRRFKDYIDKPEIPSKSHVQHEEGATDDLRVRRATNMAIDKGALAEYRRRETADGIHRRHLSGIRAAGSRLNRARRALAGRCVTQAEHDCRSFITFELSYNTTEGNKQTAEFVQAQWKRNPGSHAPQNVEWKTFDTQAGCNTTAGAGRGSATTWTVYVPGILHDETGQRNRMVRFKIRRDASWGNTQPAGHAYELLAGRSLPLEQQPIIPPLRRGPMVEKALRRHVGNPITLHPWK